MRLPVRLKAPGDSSPMDLETKDVSAGGAFIPTQNPLSVGVKVALELALLNSLSSGPRTLFRPKARVIRNEPSGMAIMFMGRSQAFA